MKSTIFMKKRAEKAAILACLIVAFVALCLTGCQTGEKVQNGEPVTLAADATQEQLQEKLADEAVGEVVLSGNISLTEPLQIVGSKTISGTGTISAEGLKGTYLIEVPAGAELILGGNVVVDAAGVSGGVHAAAEAVLTIQDQAAVKNASAETANVWVEGFLDVLAGTLSGAQGHNIYNAGETNVVGGEIRGSGTGFAGIYNEGTLSQNGGVIAGAYNNIVSAQGSKFTWNDGSNESAVNNGMVIAESAKLTVTARSAKLTGAGNLGIELNGTAVIDDITLNSCFNTMIKVGSAGNLTLNGGMIYNGSYNGIDNDGVMVMNGGDIMSCAECGIVNTGTLEVKGGGISDNGNKGILNKLEGKATVVSEDVIISGNRFAIGNDDKAYFELAKANLMMSTTSNIYALDGEMYIHDIELAASSSNNIRVVAADLTMKNVKVNGNASTGSHSMHGIILEGGTVTATNLTVCNTTGAGIRNKGGVFTGENVTLTNNAYIGIYTSDQDVTGRPGVTILTNLTVSKQGYMSISSNGTGVMEITNAVFEATPSNNIRVNGGTLKLNKVEVKGHTSQATTAHHGIYLEGGEVIANDLTISNTKGHGLRNKSGDFTGTNVVIKNVNGDAAVSNVLLADGTSGTITLNNVSFSNVKSKNIVNEAGTTIVNGSYLSAAPGSNIKITGGAVSLNGVTVAGNVTGLNGTYHAVILENGYGALYMNNVTITNAKNSGIRNKTGLVSGSDVTIKNCGDAAISNSQDKTRGLKGTVKIDGLTTENCGNNNIIADAGEVHVSNATLGPTPSNNVKTSGTGVITLNNAQVNGSTGSYGVICEGGSIDLTDVTIQDCKNAGIRVNNKSGTVTGKNVTIENTDSHALYVDKGSVIIDGLTTKNIGQRNIQVGTNANSAEGITANGGTVKISNGNLCKTENQHSVVAYGTTEDNKSMGTTLELTDVVLHGSGNGGGSRHVLLAEGGNMKLTNVTIENANSAALRVNKAASTVEAENLTIESGYNGVTASAGNITIKNLVSKASNRNVEGTGATIVIDGATLGTTSTHNIKISKGSLTLKNATMEGSSGRGIMIEPGASDGQPIVNLEKVTISNVKSNSLENRGGKITATDLTIIDGNSNAYHSQAHADGKTLSSFTVTNYNVSGCTRAINNDAGDVSVIGGTFGSTPGHNAKATSGTVTLENVTINGTTKDNGVMAEGGDFVLTNVTIKNTAGAAVRANKAASDVNATNLVIQDSVDAVSVSNGNVTVDGLTTSNISGVALPVSGGTVTIKNATVNNTGADHVVRHEGGTLTLTDVEVGEAGEGFYQIYNTAENLNLSGKIVGNILNDKAVAVNVAAALSEDTAIVIDWTEGNAPTGTAISFAEGTVEAGQKCFTLGEIQSLTKKLIFVENTGILKNTSNLVAQVGSTEYESLEEAIAAVNELTGDVTLTILADCSATEPFVVPAGMNLTIQGDESVVGLNATVKVSEGASLTIGENVNIANVDATAGGTIIYAGNTATAESPLTVTVKGEPHEVALTIAEGNAATAEMFKLVDAEGTVYGSMLEDGKVKVYTKDVTDTESLQAAISGAPVNAKGFIILKSDISLGAAITIEEGIDLTVLDDGNKRSIVRDTTNMPLVDFLTVNKGGKLTITGSSADNGITLDSKKKNNLIVVNGGDVVLTNVNLTNAGTGGSALVNFKGGTFTATNGDFSVGKHAVLLNAGLSESDVVTLNDVNMSGTTSNTLRVDSGVLNLNGTTTISGITSTESGVHGIYVNGGTVKSTGTLNITANKGSAVRISSATTGSLTAETVELTAPSYYAVYMDAGSFTVTKGGSIYGTRSFQLGSNGDASSAAVNLTNVTLKMNASGQNNIKAARGTITLTNVTFEGAGNHGVILEGGTPKLVLNNVSFNNIGGSAVRNKTGIVEGSNVTINGAGIGLYNEAENCEIDIDGLTIVNATSDVEIYGGTAALANVSANVNVHSGTLSVSGKVVSSIYFETDGSRTLNVSGALTEGSNVVVDWAEGKAPTGTAIQFASADVLTASRDRISLGAVQAAAYELSYGETTATLVAKADTANQQ